MKITMKKRWFLGILVFFLMLSGCSGGSEESYPSTYPESEGATLEQVRWPAYPGTSVLSDGIVEIDYSCVSQGYIGARKLTDTGKSKIQVLKDDKKYNYDITDPNYIAFPLQMGDGLYTLKILQQIEGTRYAISASVQVEVSLENEFDPFLYPNQVVNYTPDSQVVEISFDLVKDDTDDLTRLAHLFQYVVDILDYDDDKAVEVQDAYVLPDLDEAMESGKGICFDYASLLAALCRIQGFPARVIVGWTDIEYHAWVEIYLEGEGWINPKIYFTEHDWSLVDPTFSDARNTDYEGKYEEVYRY